MRRGLRRACVALVLSVMASGSIPAGAQDERMPALPSGRVASDPQLAAMSEAWHAHWRSAVESHLHAVAARGTPRDFLAAGLLWPPSEEDAVRQEGPLTPPQARAWLQAAYDADTPDPLVAWTLLDACPWRGLACDSSVLMQRLLSVDADNAEIQLDAYAEAAARGDPAQAERHWQAAVAAPRYHSRMKELGALLATTLRGAAAPRLDPRLAVALGEDLGLGRPATPRDMADVLAMAVNTVIAMPALLPVTQRCSPQAGRVPAARLEECRRLYGLLAEDESILITQSLALPRLVEWSGNDGQGMALRERLRRFAWVYEGLMPDPATGSPARVVPDDYLDRFMREGELSAMRHQLEFNGIAGEPPAGWLPANPYWRNLVMSGTASSR